MKKYIFATVIALTFSFAFTQISFAVCGGASPNFFCNDGPPNPDFTGIQQGGNNGNLTVNVTDGAGIDTSGNIDPCIGVGDGDNDINVDGADLNCGRTGEMGGIDAGKGNNTIDVTDSTIVAGDCIDSDSEDNTVATVNVTGSTLTAFDDCVEVDRGNDIVNLTDVICSAGTGGFGDGVELDNGNDTINILRSEIACISNVNTCNAVEGNNGDDIVTVVESTLSAPLDALGMEGQDDTVILGNGAKLEGRINCGNQFDTIVFAMDVPEEALPLISSEIAAATLPDGSITINGLIYEWIDCELLVNQLNGVRVVRPIPTLSEWGLIAMAGVLGLIGLFAIRRKLAA